MLSSFKQGKASMEGEATSLQILSHCSLQYIQHSLFLRAQMHLKITQRYLKGCIWRIVHQWPPLKDCSNFYDHSVFTKARVLHSDNFQGCLCVRIISEPEAPAVVCIWFLARMLKKESFSQWCKELPWKTTALNFNSKGWLHLNFLDM